MGKIKILIVDDEKLIREGLKLMLSTFDDIEVVDTAENGYKALELCKTKDIDVVLMDIRMKDCDGVMGTRLIKEQFTKVKVIILTTFNDKEYIQDALSYGAFGYMLKDSSYQVIYEGIKAAYMGNMVVHPEVANKILTKSNDENKGKELKKYNFSEKELQIIKYIAEGLSNKEISDKVYLSEGLEVTGLGDRKKEKVKKFSGGMKRRLNIAAAIMHHPKVLIMDEPTVGVDPQSRNHIFNFTKNICKEWGTTVIYTSHYMEEVEELCRRVFIIDLGKEIAYGTEEEIKASVFPNNKVTIEAKDISAELILNIEKVNGVLNVKEKEETITLTIDSNFKLHNVLTIIEQYDINIKKISYEEAKLEDVFLTLTGKTLRD